MIRNMGQSVITVLTAVAVTFCLPTESRAQCMGGGGAMRWQTQPNPMLVAAQQQYAVMAAVQQQYALLTAARQQQYAAILAAQQNALLADALQQQQYAQYRLSQTQGGR